MDLAQIMFSSVNCFYKIKSCRGQSPCLRYATNHNLGIRFLLPAGQILPTNLKVSETCATAAAAASTTPITGGRKSTASLIKQATDPAKRPVLTCGFNRRWMQCIPPRTVSVAKGRHILSQDLPLYGQLLLMTVRSLSTCKPCDYRYVPLHKRSGSKAGCLKASLPHDHKFRAALQNMIFLIDGGDPYCVV